MIDMKKASMAFSEYVKPYDIIYKTVKNHNKFRIEKGC